MPKTILMVDDTTELFVFYSLILERAGFNFLSAKDGDMALLLLNEGDTLPDLMIFDTMMPGIDGIGLCKLMRERDDTADIPIIIMGSGHADEVMRALEAGANDFALKPSLSQNLVQIAKKWTDESSESAEKKSRHEKKYTGD